MSRLREVAREGGHTVEHFSQRTEVTFSNLTEDAVRAYVSTGEPMDKAGGYGIQGIGGCLVQSINGCFYNVMGFPLNAFSERMDDIIARGLLLKAD